jgi:hypothetical protein
VSENASSGRKKVARVGIVGGLMAALALLVPWKRCGGELGLPGFSRGTGPGEIDDTPGTPSPPMPSPLAQPPRCQVRLDATGLTLAGSPSERAAAVAACAKAGAADVVVTGEAPQGAWDALKGELDKAGVKTYVRGAPQGDPGGPAAVDAAPSTP